jgi:Fe-S oxidoreductase
LLWVGCGGALVERNQKIVRALAQLLSRAGVKFAILGREEKCTGDPARRIGNEFLFETLVKENVATLDRYGVKRIVTSCPHCFNTLSNEYPQWGGRYEVLHHSQFLAGLVAEGKLAAPSHNARKITFHDPCYLGRHNGEFDAPRRVLGALPGARLVEMAQCREKGFCCGAGGGLYWTEDRVGQRVNHVRTDHVAATGAEVVATACPFCLLMLEDGRAARAAAARPMDIAELLGQTLRGPG